MDKGSMHKCNNSFCDKKYKILYLPENIERNKFLYGEFVEGYFVLECQLEDKSALFLPEGVNRSEYFNGNMPSGYFIYDSSIPGSSEEYIPTNIYEQLIYIINEADMYSTNSDDSDSDDFIVNAYPTAVNDTISESYVVE